MTTPAPPPPSASSHPPNSHSTHHPAKFIRLVPPTRLPRDVVHLIGDGDGEGDRTDDAEADSDAARRSSVPRKSSRGDGGDDSNTRKDKDWDRTSSAMPAGDVAADGWDVGEEEWGDWDTPPPSHPPSHPPPSPPSPVPSSSSDTAGSPPHPPPSLLASAMSPPRVAFSTASRMASVMIATAEAGKVWVVGDEKRVVVVEEGVMGWEVRGSVVGGGDGDHHTAILLLPFFSPSTGMGRSTPSTTYLLVGYASGTLRVYTKSCHLLLSIPLYQYPILRLRYRPPHPTSSVAASTTDNPNSQRDTDDVLALHQGGRLAVLDGTALWVAVRIAAAGYGGGPGGGWGGLGWADPGAAEAAAQAQGQGVRWARANLGGQSADLADVVACGPSTSTYVPKPLSVPDGARYRGGKAGAAKGFSVRYLTVGQNPAVAVVSFSHGWGQ
ncbi:hypothetical protein M427DRAFT_375933 [Gonapodya prolifera JEL478]|uniref:Rab3-GAP regulatory subunit N-terminal domain-containing protein n=1 Tax=Gonapodya prolifera (strain JEL478) TaxID=1344416 RepID=A0A139AV49_GONPJ|nr:hypothetical protein M427DRAFT_375933 [Gonapodya prolifera JEL478]|eukprot:KXS20453.1 hypothetical protein M427DRAFT_375933 [Gonapodya prolifera JEL478]